MTKNINTVKEKTNNYFKLKVNMTLYFERYIIL